MDIIANSIVLFSPFFPLHIKLSARGTLSSQLQVRIISTPTIMGYHPDYKQTKCGMY
jgi:hypothetical protein